MGKEVVKVELEASILKAVDALAHKSNATRDDVLRRAIEREVAYESYVEREASLGLDDLAAGRLADERAVEGLLQELKRAGASQR